MDIDLQALGVDAASFSAHKVGGPKGVGVLYLRARTPFDPLLLGGGQEGGRRSGTQNVCGRGGLRRRLPCRRVPTPRRRRSGCGGLRDFLYARLAGEARVRATVDVGRGSADFLPNIVHVLVDGLESQTLVVRLRRAGLRRFGRVGVLVVRPRPPATWCARLGVPRERALGALRVSMGALTTERDAQAFAKAMETVLDWR